MVEIYVGDIVRLSDEYGGLLGTLEKVDDDNGAYTAVVQLSGAASVNVPPEALTYAGPPIPPEPEIGAMVLIGDVPYRREDKGWRQMGRPDSPFDHLIAAAVTGIPDTGTWGRILRRHGHAAPKGLVAVELAAVLP
jgi:hypothetical protein